MKAEVCSQAYHSASDGVAYRHGVTKPFFHSLESVADIMGEAYPEIVAIYRLLQR